jgi:hypothetical protein
MRGVRASAAQRFSRCPASSWRVMSSDPSLRATLPASSGARLAKIVLARNGSGATSISPRFRSIALTVA